MKILHVSDLHFQQRWLDWVASEASRFDLIVIAGDLLDTLSVAPQATQIEWIRGWLHALPTPTVVCSGNHDFDETDRCSWLAQVSAAHIYPDRHPLRTGLLTIEAVPYGRLPLRGGQNHLVVTHVPPAGAPTAFCQERVVDLGDRALERQLRQPALAPWIVLSGHVHEPLSWKAHRAGTWSFNPAIGRGVNFNLPNHIVLELGPDRATAEWRSGCGHYERIKLR
ncbi:MAG: hypothetical protein C0518_13670 [Opitutus sp.]|nr:hypothetical protein [Opitutus sp.]